MTVVLGDLPLAAALAAALPGPVCVGSASPVEGPWLWRQADVATGEGVAALVVPAKRVFLLCDRRVDGAVEALARAGGRPTVAVVPRGQVAPPRAGRVEVGVPWGAEHPLYRAWRDRIRSGRHVFLADLGPIGVTPVAEAVAAATAAMDDVAAGLPADRSVPGRRTTLDQLVAEVAAPLRRPARTTHLGWWLTCWQAGIDPAPLGAQLRAG